MLEGEVIGSECLWVLSTGLILPKRLGKALHDWALVIVPGDASAHYRMFYNVKILEPEHDN